MTKVCLDPMALCFENFVIMLLASFYYQAMRKLFKRLNRRSRRKIDVRVGNPKPKTIFALFVTFCKKPLKKIL